MPRHSLPRIAHPARRCAVVLALVAATTACGPDIPVPTYGADTQPAVTFSPPPRCVPPPGGAS